MVDYSVDYVIINTVGNYAYTSERSEPNNGEACKHH